MTTVFLSNLFTYNSLTRTFCVEMSELRVGCPDVITIESTKTGRQIEFYVKGRLQEFEEYDGELVGYLYESVVGAYRLHLYND